MPDHNALRIELQKPAYTGKTNEEVADMLRTTLVTVTTERDVVPAHEVWEAIVPAEWAALSAAEKQRVQTVISMGDVNLRGANTRASLAAAFAAGTQTRANLLALQTQRVDRPVGEAVFGQLPTAQDVAAARS